MSDSELVIENDGKLIDASSMLAEVGADVLTFTSFPGSHWKRVWSNNPQDRHRGHLTEPACRASAHRCRSR